MADSKEMSTMKVPAWFKDWVKAHKNDSETRRKGRDVVRMYPMVDLTVFDHRRAGELHARADKTTSGEDAGIDGIDPMLAAVAERYDEPVLTENTADFEALGVQTDGW